MPKKPRIEYAPVKANGPVYTDSKGDTWRAVLMNGVAVFMEQKDGERYTVKWVEEHCGPLTPVEES